MAKQTTLHQIELMLNFLEENKGLALGRVRGKEGNALSTRLWAKCAKILNGDIDGVQKTPQEWKRYYNSYKSRIKTKQRAIKHGIYKTGGGPAECIELTPLEERLIGILGGCSSPLPVRHDPLDGLTIEPTQEVQDVIEEQTEYVVIPKEESADYNLSVLEKSQVSQTFHAEVPVVENEAACNIRSQVSETFNAEVPVGENEAACNIRKNQKRPSSKRRSRHSSPPKKNTNVEMAEKTLMEIEVSRITADRELALSRIQADREIALSRIQANREIAQAQVEAMNTLSSSIREMAGAFTLGLEMILSDTRKRRNKRNNSDSSSADESKA